MREDTITYKVFTFNELSKEVQSKVLDKHRNWNVESIDWWDGIYEVFYEDLEEKGFSDCKIWFSGFGSQGDGASFECKSFDIAKLIQALETRIDNKRFKQYQRFITKLNSFGLFGVTITAGRTNYSHERSRKLTIDSSYMPHKLKRLNKLVNSLEEDLEELRLDLSRKIYKDLNSEYDYLTRDETLKESLEINGMEFLEDGKVY